MNTETKEEINIEPLDPIQINIEKIKRASGAIHVFSSMLSMFQFDSSTDDRIPQELKNDRVTSTMLEAIELLTETISGSAVTLEKLHEEKQCHEYDIGCI